MRTSPMPELEREGADTEPDDLADYIKARKEAMNKAADPKAERHPHRTSRHVIPASPGSRLLRSASRSGPSRERDVRSLRGHLKTGTDP
jgi:hypothetical protein